MCQTANNQTGTYPGHVRGATFTSNPIFHSGSDIVIVCCVKVLLYQSVVALQYIRVLPLLRGLILVLLLPMTVFDCTAAVRTVLVLSNGGIGLDARLYKVRVRTTLRS